MKRLFAFILSIIYLTSSVGATVHVHYCMNKLVNWSLTDKEGDDCDNCGMKKNDNCCKDEHKFIKNTTDQKTTPDTQLKLCLATAQPEAFINNAGHYICSLIEKHPISHTPPSPDDVGLNILNCVFRI